MRRRDILMAGALTLATPSWAAGVADKTPEPDEKPGSYRGDFVAKFDDNGRTVTLVQPFEFDDASGVQWPVPAGAIVDGASIPMALWSISGGPFEGKYRNASVIHDWFCDRRSRPWQDVHRMFLRAMLTSGVDRPKALAMYAADLKFGPRWSETVVHNNQLIEAIKSKTAYEELKTKPKDVYSLQDRIASVVAGTGWTVVTPSMSVRTYSGMISDKAYILEFNPGAIGSFIIGQSALPTEAEVKALEDEVRAVTTVAEIERRYLIR